VRISVLKTKDISPPVFTLLFVLSLMFVSVSGSGDALSFGQVMAQERPSLPLLYPLEAPPSLSSSFGTYRINHHHAGLDLYGLEGTPVRAAAKGKVHLIKRGSGGYGRAIYLKHRGEFITLYAHMSAFAPKIKSLIERSRRADRFEFKLRPREVLEVEAGEVIGYLGTSGTDLMHLHFELRYKNAPINPLTHGLTLPDTQPPKIIKLFVVPFGEKASVNGDQAPFEHAFQPRPKRIEQPALAIFSDQKAEQDTPEQDTPEQDTPEQKTETPSSPPPVIKVWGDVRLSVEIEDRVDGSARELTPYEVMMSVDGRVVHHVRYDETTYSDKRASELDFDLERRGPERALVHRLYRVGPRFRPLKRGSSSPLKKLKKGRHEVVITAIDAAGHRAEERVTLMVERPTPLPCGLKHKRLASPRLRQPRGAQPLHVSDLSWRPYGLTASLKTLGLEGFECEEGRELHVDVRWSGERARRSTVRLTRLKGEPALSFDLRRLKFGKEGRDLEALVTGRRVKRSPSKGSFKDKDKPLVDHSALLWVGVRPFKGEVKWFTLKLHEVREERAFKAKVQGGEVSVEVGEAAPFKPYLTAVSAHDFTDKERASLKAQGFEALSPEYIWAQGWLPMHKSNTITIPRAKRRKRHVGAYLGDHGRWWWVTSAWGKGEVSASSTHISSFAALRDLKDPEIGEPCWDERAPWGARLIIPISDQGSGLARVHLKVNERDALFEVQRAWERLIYLPPQPVNNGSQTLEVSVKDKSGRRAQRSFKVSWPPQKSSTCPQSWRDVLTPKRD
jgi:murein DD-endopeptidase MepM/ murein hydrolase activator NlpD